MLPAGTWTSRLELFHLVLGQHTWPPGHGVGTTCPPLPGPSPSPLARGRAGAGFHSCWSL